MNVYRIRNCYHHRHLHLQGPILTIPPLLLVLNLNCLLHLFFPSVRHGFHLLSILSLNHLWQSAKAPIVHHQAIKLF